MNLVNTKACDEWVRISGYPFFFEDPAEETTMRHATVNNVAGVLIWPTGRTNRWGAIWTTAPGGGEGGTEGALRTQDGLMGRPVDWLDTAP